MTPFVGRRLAGLAALAVLGTAAGCGDDSAPTGVTSDVDRARAEALVEEHIVRSAVGQPVVTPGVVHNELLGWNRTEVTARVYSSEGGVGPTPEALEREVAAAVTMLRNGGPRMPGHEWLVAGYKIADGVSYWVLVAGALIVDGTAFVDVILRAPNARDISNLFPIQPESIATDQRCAEDGAVAMGIEQAGTPTMMRDWWPFPAQDRSTDPHLV